MVVNTPKVVFLGGKCIAIFVQLKLYMTDLVVHEGWGKFLEKPMDEGVRQAAEGDEKFGEKFAWHANRRFQSHSSPGWD